MFLFPRFSKQQVAGEISDRMRKLGILARFKERLVLRHHSLKKFKLYLNDRTIILHDVKVLGTGSDVRIIGNPLTFSIEPVRPFGICLFDDAGIIGRLNRLPKFIWKMLRNNRREN